MKRVDKAEYRIKLEQINSLAEAGDFKGAASVADTIDWRHVKSVRTLCMVGEIYEANKRYEDSKRILQYAYKRSSISKTVLYRLAEISIRLGDYDDAKRYYNEFEQLSPNDTSRYILKYKLLRAEGATLDDQIAVLKDYKEREYTERWAYELAKLYMKNGQKQKCVEECDEMILWFADGKYVTRAMELKMQVRALTEPQKKLYDDRQNAAEKESNAEEIMESTMNAESLISKAADTAVDDEEKIEEVEEKKKFSSIDAIRKMEAAADETVSSALSGSRPNIMPGTRQSRDLYRSRTQSLAEQYAEAAKAAQAKEQPVERKVSEKSIAASEAAVKEIEAAAEAAVQSIEEKVEAAYDDIGTPPETTAAHETGSIVRSSEKTAEAAVEKAIAAADEVEEMEADTAAEADIDANAAAEKLAEAVEASEVAEEGGTAAEELVALAEEDANAAAEELAEIVEENEAAESADAAAEEAVEAADEAAEDAEETADEAVETPEEVMEETADEILAEETVEVGREIEEILAEENAEEEAEGEPVEEAESVPEEEPEAEPEASEEEVEEEPDEEPEESEEESVEEPEEEPAEESDEETAEESEEEPEEEPEEEIEEEAEEEPDEEDEEESEEDFEEEPEEDSEEEPEEESDEDLDEEPQSPTPEDIARSADEEAEKALQEMMASFLNEFAVSGSEYRMTGEVLPEEDDYDYDDEEDLSESDSEEDDKERMLGKETDESLGLTRTESFQELLKKALEEGGNYEEARQIVISSDDIMSPEEAAKRTVMSANGLEYDPDAEDDQDMEGEESTDARSTEDVEDTDSESEGTEEDQDAENAEDESGDEFEDDDYESEEVLNELVADEEDLEKRDTSSLTDILTDSEAENLESDTEIVEQIMAEPEILELVDVLPRPFTEEERALFSYFADIPGISEQATLALADIHNNAGDKTSRAGNVLVMGRQVSGKTRLADALIRSVCLDLNIKAIKIAKVIGEDLNGKDPAEIVDRMSGGFLIIEGAGSLNDEFVEGLNKAMEFRTDNLVVILEDEKADMMSMLEKHPEFAGKFTSTIIVPVFTNDELVTFARTYAKEMGYKLDEMATLALYTMIGENQKDSEPVVIGKVKKMIDQAIERSKGSKFTALFRKNAAAEDGRIWLREKDFGS